MAKNYTVVPTTYFCLHCAEDGGDGSGSEGALATFNTQTDAQNVADALNAAETAKSEPAE